jgi:serine/threonine protein kinase
VRFPVSQATPLTHELTPESWRRLDALFIAAADLPPLEQETFVAREAADDQALASQLRSMLAHASSAPDRIANAISDVAASVPPSSPSTDWIGRHFGPYRLVREIGRGGMGLVFEAVRDDQEYRKTVALKVAPWSLAVTGRDRELRERFRLERQILAELEHPHIARLLDGGTQDGVPYFVMEYVEGVPITTYGERRALGERIALFRLVCGAVRFAHERLIVHRDLKPTNILVDTHGVPTLLDFGIAKLLDPLADPSVTTPGASALTPNYTSPEQVRGQPITTRTDVYSLGLILFELFVGERAQMADASSPLALDRSICEHEPGKPSDRAEARGDRALARRLRGDLDTIVATAIRKEPERRYASAAALSDDLGRYLEGRPILARPNAPLYTAGKLLRRHRAAAIATVLVLVSVVAGAITSLYQARRAERRFQQVRTLANAFVFDVHDRIEALPGSTEARKAIVQTALTYLENLRSDAAGDPALGRELAAAYERIASVTGNPLHRNLGDTKGAVASYTRAEEILTPLADRGDRLALRQLMSVYVGLAQVRRAQGDPKAGMTFYTRAEQVGERLRAQAPDDREVLNTLGEVYSESARAAYQLGDFAIAQRRAEHMMKIAQHLLQLDPRNHAYREHLSGAHSSLGSAYAGAGRVQEAVDQFRVCVTLREQIVAEQPLQADYQRNLLIAYGHLGDMLGYNGAGNLGDIAGATVMFEKATALARVAMARDPADRRAVFDVASVTLRLGTLLADARQYDAALKPMEESYRLTTGLLAQDPASDRYGYLSVVTERRIGEVLVAQGQAAAAVRRFERAHARAAALPRGPSDANVRLQLALLNVNLARLRAEAGDLAARALADAAAAELARKPLDTPAVDGRVAADIGRTYLTLSSRYAPAERDALIRAALAQLEQAGRLWRQATLAPPLEHRRTEALAAIETATENGRRLLASR